jgi:predicted GIY-YIG superfamily endonuclease
MPESEERWFCYILQCGDGSLYVGVAKDLERRVKRHSWGVGSRHTALRRPVKLVWQDVNQRSARGREAELKGWRREKKLELIATFQREIHPSP